MRFRSFHRRAGAALTAGMVVVGAVPGGVAASSSRPPRAALRGFSCHRALDPPLRNISVQAVMRHVVGTQAMAIRFDLLRRSAGAGAFLPVHVGDLGTWLSPADPPTLGRRPGDVWILAKPVVGLPAPATYRLRATFRWTDPAGRVIRLAEVTSAPCVQLELRPDLRIQSITVAPAQGHPRQATYSVMLSNLGVSAAGPFTLAFSPADGVNVVRRTVQRLGPHASTMEVFTARACTSATAPTVTADPDRAVDDLNPSDNSLAVGVDCPSSVSQPVPVARPGG